MNATIITDLVKALFETPIMELESLLHHCHEANAGRQPTNPRDYARKVGFALDKMRAALARVKQLDLDREVENGDFSRQDRSSPAVIRAMIAFHQRCIELHEAELETALRPTPGDAK